MSMRIQSSAAKRIAMTLALLVGGSSAALAFGVFPGSWKIIDSGKAVRKPPSGMKVAVVNNNGPDTIRISSKGTNQTPMETLNPGEKIAFLMPLGAKNVKIVDSNPANGTGAKGLLFWAKKLPKTGEVGGATGQQ